MSKILRRPMFRGGPVNSYNTGITSGLGEPGYADGGRVALGVGGFLKGLFTRGPAATTATTANPPLSGYALKSSVGANTPVSYPSMSYSDIIGVGDAYRKIKPFITSKPSMISALAAAPFVPGFVTDSGYLIGGGEEEQFIKDYGAEILGKETSTGEAIEGYYLTKNQKRAADLLKRGGPGDKEEAEKLIKSSTPQTVKEPTKSELDKLKEYYENLMSEKEKQYKAQFEKTKEPVLTEEEEITKQAKLYEKLLGGEEARSQAAYDALLAAAPAFFKGRNLREAAPQVLESINKSGAFDKPRDIKQAAAQLAIQRRMLIDKASAEEKQRLAVARIAAESREKGFTEELKQIKEITGRGAIDDEISFDFSNLRSNEFYQQIQKYKDGNQISVVNPKTGQRLYLKIKSTDPKNPNAPKGFERIGGNIQ